MLGFTREERGAARRFLGRLSDDPVARLDAIGARLETLPYENLTKLVAWADAGRPVHRRPLAVLADHRTLGAGGTCYALTLLLGVLLEEAGLDWAPLLAERFDGVSHSAVVATAAGRRYLIDPGYLLARPIPLDGPRTLQLPGETLALDPTADGWALASLVGPNRLVRHTYVDRPASADELAAHWDASFEGPMMRSLVLCRRDATGRRYQRDGTVHAIGASGREQVALTPDAASAAASAAFGVTPALVAQARRALAELHG